MKNQYNDMPVYEVSIVYDIDNYAAYPFYITVKEINQDGYDIGIDDSALYHPHDRYSKQTNLKGNIYTVYISAMSAQDAEEQAKKEIIPIIHKAIRDLQAFVERHEET